MARRDFLTDTERRALFGIPTAREDLARHYMLSGQDLTMVSMRRGYTNRVGFAVQLALLRHPGSGFTLEDGAPAHLVAFICEQIGVAASAFNGYAARPATASVHAREAEASLGLRQPTNADLPLLIDAGAQAAWSTDRGVPIVAGITEAFRASGISPGARRDRVPRRLRDRVTTMIECHRRPYIAEYADELHKVCNREWTPCAS